MEGFIIIFCVLLVVLALRIVVSVERFVDRWLRVKEGRPMKADRVDYYSSGLGNFSNLWNKET